ncbi:MAG: MGMT family protein [Saprospiraceae bacterium]|nr:MGMT family protein [Saprospiraceae bacterium]
MEKEKNHYWQDVFAVVRLIPRGRISTYGAIADYLRLGSPRMVGWALNNCGHDPNFIPAHRVVNRKGELSGRHHFNPPKRMQQLLEAEDIIVLNDQVQDFGKLLWQPLTDLELDADLDK